MAKDRRNKVRPKLDLESDMIAGGATSHRSSTVRDETPSQAKTSASKKKRKKKKKKISRAALIIRCVLAVFVVTVLVFLAVLANYIYNAVFVDETEKVSPISPTTYDVTPVEDQDKVAYYLVGILGEDDDDDTTMLSVVCHDKKNNTVNVLQLPQATYIEEDDSWAVNTVGAVFANPKALDWCEVCRKRVYAPEINEGEIATHTVCGTEITWKKGSAVSGLVDFVNDQLGLPVDEYFLLPQGAVSQLVDAVGGVDVELGGSYTLGGTAFDSGVQTLFGDAAAEYVCEWDGSQSDEATRMIRQREVFGALLTRLYRMQDTAAIEEIVEDVMDSSSAIRTDCSVSQVYEVLMSMSSTGVAGMTVHILPGEAAVEAGGDTVYSVHMDELLTLLNGSFNPYGAAIAQTDLLIPQLIDSGDADMKTSALDAYVVDQTGMLLDTELE